MELRESVNGKVPLLKISVPAPDLSNRVAPPQAIGMLMFNTSVRPSTRMSPCVLVKFTTPVVPSPPLITEVPPPVFKMPPVPVFPDPFKVSEAFSCMVRSLAPTIFRLPFKVPFAKVVAG